MVEVLTESNQSLDCLEALCAKYPVEQGIVATVIDLSERVLAALVALPFPLLWLDSKTPLPVTNLYETPETLGYDRMAAVVGANEQYPRRDILVIDAGTCITYEFIDSKGQYHGGNISPGMQMRFKALVSRLNRPEVRFHDIRHTYATLAIQSEIDFKTLSLSLGHATVAFTLDTYGHVSNHMSQNAAAKMEKFICSL